MENVSRNAAAANALIAVWLDVAPEREEEFNDWYNRGHIAQVVGLPGFVSARRYRCDDAPLKYLAWYDTVDENVEPGPDFQRIVAEPTPWSRRMRKLYGEKRERFNLRLMRDVGRVAEHDTPWTEKMRSVFQNTRRSMCRLILPSIRHPQDR